MENLHINCRYRTRKDIGMYLGFFANRGVLTFNELGAFIVDRLNGEHTVEELVNLVEKNFSLVENPNLEVENVVKQLQDAKFIN